jgi:FkbM family methyltransferase
VIASVEDERGYAGAVLRKLAAHLRITLRLWRRSRRVSTVLAGNRLQRLWLRVVPVLLLWAAPFVGPVRSGVPVRFTFNGSAVRCFLGEVCEYEVLEEIFVDEIYALDFPSQVATIVDLGSNVGVSALYFKTLHPSARVLAVEPNPALLGRLRRNLGELDGVVVASVAVTEREGEARLQVPSGSWSGRLGEGRGYPVPTVTLNRLLAEHGLPTVDLLKFDIEGAEFGALKVADLSRVDALVGELHPDRPAQMRELTALLERDFTVKTQRHPRAALWLMRARRHQPLGAADPTRQLT